MQVIANVPSDVVLPTGSERSDFSNSFNIRDACGVIAVSCGNNGRCVLGRCECKPGWSGDTCKIPAVCAGTANPCSERGNCTQAGAPLNGTGSGSGSGAICLCQEGYYGPTCSLRASCAASIATRPACVNGFQTSSCACSCSAGWTGFNCNTCNLKCGFGAPAKNCRSCVCRRNFKVCL